MRHMPDKSTVSAMPMLMLEFDFCRVGVFTGFLGYRLFTVLLGAPNYCVGWEFFYWGGVRVWELPTLIMTDCTIRLTSFMLLYVCGAGFGHYSGWRISAAVHVSALGWVLVGL